MRPTQWWTMGTPISFALNVEKIIYVKKTEAGVQIAYEGGGLIHLEGETVFDQVLQYINAKK